MTHDVVREAPSRGDIHETIDGDATAGASGFVPVP
jgi:hypothetical protein